MNWVRSTSAERNKRYRARLRGESVPPLEQRPRKPVQRRCKQCGEQYSVYPSRTHITRYCSRHCADAAKVRPKAPKLVTCLRCGAQTSKRWATKYCSDRCRILSKPRRQSTRPKVSRCCTICGREFRSTPPSGRHKRLFCSRSCAGVANRREPASGPVGRPGYRGAKWRQIAALVRERDHDTCRNCGTVRPQDAKQNWPVDHVRPWRLFDTIEAANDPSNLVTLCPSCHSRKTHGIERRALNGDWSLLTRWGDAVKVAVPDPAGELSPLAAHKVPPKGRTCAWDDCDEIAKSGGMCFRHYDRVRYAKRRAAALTRRAQDGVVA